MMLIRRSGRSSRRHPQGGHNMRNSECTQYLQCLDEATRGNGGKLDCKDCRHYIKAPLIKTEIFEDDPDLVIRKLKGGEIIMATKICSNPNCKHGGEAQDIGRFGRNPGCKDGHEGQCYDCKTQQAKDLAAAKAAGTYVPRRGQKKKGEAQGVKKLHPVVKKPAAPPEQRISQLGSMVSLDLNEWPEIRKALGDAIASRIKSVNLQISAG